VLTLDVGASAQQAALTMSGHGIRHVPLTEGGRVVGLVSEGDLFRLQRHSLKGLGGAIRAAADVPALVAVAADVRRFAQQLLAQGLTARSLTALTSQLNDLLTERLVVLLAARHGRDLRRACWLAFGSEGRSEQTIATDQDNGLVFESADADAERPAWLAFAREINEALDACGYPLCKGNVMASNPACCLTPAEWAARFDHWMEHGAPEDLLNASIYFDFRPLAGDAQLAAPMREMVTRRAAQLPRFRKQLADNALRSRPPLNWRGALEPTVEDGRRWIDLKLGGSALFVDAARLFALAHGVAVTGTRARFEAVAPRLGLEQEVATWIGAFELLQMFRLRVQGGEPAAATDNPNRVDLATLNPLDLHVLRESFRVARRLQQRIELDYPG
jgi:CBS domain-containing protein